MTKQRHFLSAEARGYRPRALSRLSSHLAGRSPGDVKPALHRRLINSSKSYSQLSMTVRQARILAPAYILLSLP
jgi:hypothetical protein